MASLLKGFKYNSQLASWGSAVVEPLTSNPDIEGLNPFGENTGKE
jgi:hypothetical protein